MPQRGPEELTDMLQNMHRDGSNSDVCAPDAQWMQITTGASPTPAYAHLMHSCVLRWP